MNEIIQTLTYGLRLGSIYALVAIGYSMVYGILRLINFAHGDIMTLGVFLILVLMTSSGLPLPVILVLSMLFAVVAGLLLERLAYRPLRTAGEEATLISSLAMSTLLQNLMLIIFREQKQPFKLPDHLTREVPVGSITIAPLTVIIIAVTALLLAVLTFVIRKTRIGVAMRACSENQNAAKLTGININKVIMFTFAVGSALAVLAGFALAGTYQQVYPTLGFSPSMKAFCAAVIGGIGSLGGSVVGGLLIGIGEIFFSRFVPPSIAGYQEAFIYLLMMLVLLFRPNGLFGSKEGGRS